MLTELLASLPGMDVRSLFAQCGPIFTQWFAGTALLVKLPLLRFITRCSWGKCALADFGMGAASALLVARFPIVGIPWWIAWTALGVRDPYRPIHWLSYFALSAAVATGLDILILRLALKLRCGLRDLCLLCFANAVSVGVAVYASAVYARAHPAIA